MREAVALALNMTYMFSTDQYADSTLKAWKGKLYAEGGPTDIIDNNVLLQNIRKNRKLVIGLTTNVGGLGGGVIFGLGQRQFLEHYADDRSNHEIMFHEFGHCLGYDRNPDGSHTSNMTYGLWKDLNSKVYERLSRTKELPIYSRKFLNSRQNDHLYDHSDAVKQEPSKFVIE